MEAETTVRRRRAFWPELIVIVLLGALVLALAFPMVDEAGAPHTINTAK